MNKETGETKIVYMHHVLEAKLVVGDMVFSIGTEFIENENKKVSKQNSIHDFAVSEPKPFR